ncbi:MAG: DUF4190 domain-containing protein, partial [Sedimentisphaerales bacterium]|nr:DUF4190 domain-containing protein [Sedimentisphaerales bacterium]
DGAYGEPIVPKTSGLAITALVLGILSLFTLFLTGIPSIICGIIALVKIEKSGGRITGKGFAVAGIVLPVVLVPVIALLMGILMPALARVRQIAFRQVCGTNLAGLGKATMLYAYDNDDEFPRAGGRTTTWGSRIPNWMATNRFQAYGLASDTSSGTATITSSLYLLVKYDEVTPKSFVCKGDHGVTEFNPADEGVFDMDMTQLWDFGSNPAEHCSYAYHLPYNNSYALQSSGDPGFAVLADRNPWISGPSYEPDPTLFTRRYNPDGGRDAVSAGNSPSHQYDSQNVLFLDLHVDQEKTPACGVNDDNIYTFLTSPAEDCRYGSLPALDTRSYGSSDSYLVNDIQGGRGLKGRSCFLAETPVWINGSAVQISNVAAGQMVNSLASASIEKLEVHEGTFEVRDIVLESGNCISVAESHLFMLESGQWVKAQQLRSGLNLKTANGTVAVKCITTRAMPYVGKVYNVKVSGSDWYMVGQDMVIVRDY